MISYHAVARISNHTYTYLPVVVEVRMRSFYYVKTRVRMFN